MKILNILFLMIILLIVVSVASLILINNHKEKQHGWCGGSKHFTGKMHSYDVYYKTPHLQYKIMKTSERYDDKFFGYLEHIQEQRDKTFMKGRVFLRER